MLECLLYGEVNLLCITMLSIMIYKVMRVGADVSVKKKTFVLSMLFALPVNILDILWEIGFTKTLPVPPVAMHFINTFYFLSMSGMGVCFFLFSDVVQGRRTWRDPTFWLFASMPILLLTTLSVASFFDGCLMSFDADGNYCRGPLFYLQHILSFGYVAIASVKNLVGMISRRTYAQKEGYGILFSFVVPPAVCIVLQCFFQWVPILSVAPTISFLLIYTSSLQSQLSLDPLTGIYNRRQILLALSDRMHNVPKNRELYFFFLDINAFKTINDTYGHYAGDRILQRVADALQSVCAETKGICGRYGGDEFAYMQDFRNEQEAEQMAALLARRIRERCADDDRIAAPAVTVSIGWARYDREKDDLPALIARADQRMYARKAQTKRRATDG